MVDLISSFEEKWLEIEGNVLTGVGEGQFYINVPGYMDQFSRKLGFIPFPGTLNVKVSNRNISNLNILKDTPFIKIDGFSDGCRTYGEVLCYPVSIDGIEAAVVVPKRTHYPKDLIEIMAPVRLRDALNVQDGDLVVVKFKI